VTQQTRLGVFAKKKKKKGEKVKKVRVGWGRMSLFIGFG